MTRSSKTIIGLGFWLVMVALVGNAWLTYRGLRTIVSNGERINRTSEIVAALEQTLSVLKDAETGQRGYLLTSKTRYLEPYLAATGALGRSLDRVAALTADNPATQAQIVSLRQVVTAKMAELGHTVALHDEKGAAAALEVVQTDTGERLMDQARDLVAGIETEENHLSARLTAVTEVVTRRTLVTFLMTTGAVLILVLSVSYLRRRIARQTKRIHEAVSEEREWLSTTLNSIGDAVIATDYQGRVVFLNPIAETLTGWTQNEAMGRSIVEVFPILNEYTREPVEDPIGKVLREGRVIGLANHTLLIARNGTETAIDDSAAPIKNQAGSLIGAVLVFRDITERKAQDKAFAEQKRLAEFGRDLGIVLTENVPLNDMLTRCVEVTVHHLDGAFARIWTVDESGTSLELQSSAGMYTHIDGSHARIPIGQFKIGRIAEERQPHLTNSVIGDPQVPAQEWAIREGMVAFAGYPLIVDDRLIGVWAMFARHPLSEAALRKMASVSRQIAVGIDRKVAEQQLHQEREWLTTTLSSIGDAVIATDVQGRVKFLNSVAEDLTGWTQATADGRPIVEIFSILNEYTREIVESPVDKVMREGVVVGLANHTILVARDGTETAIDDSAAPIKDERGEMIGVVMVFRDASEQRRHEANLREKEERHRAILESISDAFFALDRDWRFTYINHQAERLVNRTPGELMGKVFWDEFPGVVGTEFEQLHRRAMNEGIASSVAAFYPDHDRWYEVYAYPAKDGLSIYFRDVTERKRFEEENARLAAASEQQRRTYETALSNTPDFNYIFDLEGRFTYVNAALLDLWQKDLSEAVGKNFHELDYPPDLAAHLQQQIRQAIDTKQPVRGETPFTSHLGERQYEYIFMAVLDADGAVEAVSGSTRDITERRRHEEAMRAARDEAEQANQAKDQFLAVLSHELRTPLNPVLLATTAMLEYPTPPSEIRPTLEMIRQNVNLQARLIDDLLDVMRIVQGKMPLHWGIVDCHDQVHRALEICRSEIEEKHLHLVLNLAAEHRHANADAARLQQVLWNLIKNAVKFTPSEGTVSIASWNEGARESQGWIIVLEVADTGIGIEPDLIPKIFDPFQQGETTITRKFGGLGLGLAISRGIVEAHGGLLHVESPGAGKGTTFRIGLRTMNDPPRLVDAPPLEIAESKPPAHVEPCRILVVEDEPATLHLMARLLRSLGHEVKTAGSISDATEVLNDGGFDLFISDIGLPDGSGLDLMRKVVSAKGSIPSIALTGYGMDEDIRRSRDAGFTSHMTKPIDFGKLEAMIRQVRV